MIKIFITGGDKAGWALDQEVFLLQRFYKLGRDFMIVPTIEEADVIHSVWWEQLCELPIEILKKKFIICSLSNRPFHYFTEYRFSVILGYVDLVVSQTLEAFNELNSLGIYNFLLPYTIDTLTFTPNLQDKNTLREKYNIPADKYVIGNFHRDSEGANLYKVKVQKGADVLFEIINKLYVKNKRVHMILAGPRRHWLRKKLNDSKIPYTFIGQITDQDDYAVNILSQAAISELYKVMDTTIVSSRWEGAPRSILEAAASKVKIISTDVGVARDILDGGCIFKTFLDGAEIIQKDIDGHYLDGFVQPNYDRIQSDHTPEALYRKRYPEYVEIIRGKLAQNKMDNPGNDKILLSIKSGGANTKKTTIGIWHKFFAPPYGGGNQFMSAIVKRMKKLGMPIIFNSIKRKIDCYILNSVHFEVDKFLSEKKKNNINVVHRIDGPIQIYRGSGPEMDNLAHEINKKLAAFTILQSDYVLRENVKLGYSFTNPVIIRNACDKEIFNREGKTAFSHDRKIKLISTSWSNNVKKGASIYKWLDANLDFSLFEYTFVGNVTEQFRNIKIIPPVDSETLAQYLKQHDIYLTASQNDPCSNALIEALSCGLPAVYLNSGGHPELVSFGGLGFDKPEEIPGQIAKLATNYEAFQNLITVNDIDEVTEKYLKVVRAAVGDESKKTGFLKNILQKFIK